MKINKEIIEYLIENTNYLGDDGGKVAPTHFGAIQCFSEFTLGHIETHFRLDRDGLVLIKDTLDKLGVQVDGEIPFRNEVRTVLNEIIKAQPILTKE